MRRAGFRSFALSEKSGGIGETAAVAGRAYCVERVYPPAYRQTAVCAPMGLFFCPNSVKLSYNSAPAAVFTPARVGSHAHSAFPSTPPVSRMRIGLWSFPLRAGALYLRSPSDAWRAAAFRHFRRRVFNLSRRQFPAVRAARIPRPSAPRRRRCALLFRPLPSSSRA